MSEPTAADLARVPLLADLPEEIRSALASRLETEEHDAGHVVVAEGRAGYAFYLVASGSLVVTAVGAELRRLGAGDYFGEISILGDGRRTATVTATEPTTLWVLFGTEFRVLQMSRPDVATALANAVDERLSGG